MICPFKSAYKKPEDKSTPDWYFLYLCRPTCKHYKKFGHYTICDRTKKENKHEERKE